MASKKTFPQWLIDALVEQGVIDQGSIAEIEKSFGPSSQQALDSFLLEEGLVEKDVLLKALAEYYQVPAFDVVGHFFDTNLLQKFPKGFLLRNAVIPLMVDENMLVVVANEPERSGLESELRGFVSYDINYRVGIARDICDAVKEYYDISVTEIPDDEKKRKAMAKDEDDIQQLLANLESKEEEQE